MGDVYDGALYQNLSKPGNFLSSPQNISFLGNTDGVALIKSTGWSVWPVYLVINELPPLLRSVPFVCTETFIENVSHRVPPDVIPFILKQFTGCF